MAELPVLKSSQEAGRTTRFVSEGVSLATKARLTSYYQGGHTLEHDKQWTDGELAQMALYYICPEQYKLLILDGAGNEQPLPATFKPVPYLRGKESRIRLLVEGIALAIAEVDRLLDLPEEDYLN
jgi:hypothetical protein